MVSFDSGPSVHWLNEVSRMNFESPMSLVSLSELTMLAGATLCNHNPGLIVRILAGQLKVLRPYRKRRSGLTDI